MQVFVKSLDNTFVVNLSEDATLADLNRAIEDVEFIPAEFQRVVIGSTEISAGSLLNVVGDSETVTLWFDVYGGMRAKWRKKRMRRLRRKRRKMRMRAK